MRCGIAILFAMTMLTNAAAVSAQRTNVWVDGSVVHSRPPGSTEVAASRYGLLGVRLRHAQGAGLYELSATGGRGSTSADGGWLSSRGAYDLARVSGHLDFGIRLEANGLAYVSPVQLGGGNEYTQASANATAQPHVGLSIAGFRIGAEASATRGGWRVETSSPLSGGGLPPLSGSAPRRSEVSTGTTAVSGGALSVLRVLGPASVTLRASTYDARNQLLNGKYSGVQGAAGFSAGPADIVVGLTRWQSPADTVEIGAQASIGFAVGRNAYIQAAAGRGVSDPLSGASGSVAANLALSLRVGGGNNSVAATVGPPARSTAAQPVGYAVTFVFKDADAESVAVAGDFSGWEPRSLQRGRGSSWTLVTVLPPGVYHYSFVVNGTQWTLPDNATGIVDDGFGRKNATLIVSAPKGQAGS